VPKVYDPKPWMLRALCARTDPDTFFPDMGQSVEPAKRVCMGCEVRGECLEYALINHERHGVWGGLSERQRRKLEGLAA
jgi:WhiB family redox-sensing transcriptional regulator